MWKKLDAWLYGIEQRLAKWKRKRTREVFYAPTAGRHFFTKKAAIRAEAIAMVNADYPKEKAEYDDDFGRCTYPGYQMPDDEFWPLVREKIRELNGVKG